MIERYAKGKAKSLFGLLKKDGEKAKYALQPKEEKDGQQGSKQTMAKDDKKTLKKKAAGGIFGLASAAAAEKGQDEKEVPG